MPQTELIGTYKLSLGSQEVGQNLEEATRQRINLFQQLGIESHRVLSYYQEPNGLIQASIGRYDDPYFDGMVWEKDVVRAVKYALNPLVRSHLVQLWSCSPTPDQVYLSAMRGLILVHAQKEQLRRLQSRPGPADQDGYSTIDDHDAPAIKCNLNGEIVNEWGHSQPDNQGIFLSEFGKGLQANLPLLDRIEDISKAPGEILQEIVRYVVNLRTERLICRSIWEHNKGYSSYSTRRIVLAGLEQMAQVWEIIENDSQEKGYPLVINKEQILEAAGSLREKVKEHFPADYTDSEGHYSMGDLASLVVLNDIALPEDEQREILGRIFDAELENRDGFFRYLGDPWKQGRAEAKWTMGKYILANYYFKRAIHFYSTNLPIEGHRALDHGLERVSDLLALKDKYGYVPELLKDKGRGIYGPNNNRLAWNEGYNVEAMAAGITASLAAEEYYQKHAT